LLLLFGSQDDTVRLALCGLVALLVLRGGSMSSRRTLPVLLVAVVTLGLTLGRSRLPDAMIPFAPFLTLADSEGDDIDVARWANRNVDPDAVFLAPASHGAFRIHARRALVVDWKALPFEDLSMREWRERILVCYGEIASTGFDGEREMDANYRAITDAKLGAIRERYGARFAVLFRETPTGFPVLYANGTYQVVAL
jgi:hypothetical protein